MTRLTFMEGQTHDTSPQLERARQRGTAGHSLNRRVSLCHSERRVRQVRGAQPLNGVASTAADHIAAAASIAHAAAYSMRSKTEAAASSHIACPQYICVAARCTAAWRAYQVPNVTARRSMPGQEKQPRMRSTQP